MDLLTPDPHAAAIHAAALTRLGHAARDGLGPAQQALLRAIGRRVLGTEVDPSATPPDLTPRELAEATPDPALARQLIRLMVTVALADGPPSLAQIEQLRAAQTALQVREPAVDVIAHLARGHVRRFRAAFLRRSHIRAYLRNSVRLAGSRLRVLRSMLIFRGVLRPDADQSARFHALARLPEGTLGRRFFHHCADAGLPFPGEAGGFPAGAIFHDVAHVLAGYDTSPEGEMKAAAFQAGFTHGDHDFFTWLFSIVIHTTGVNVAPFPMPHLPGRIAQGSLADDVLQALRRGTAVNRDLGDGWDFWDVAELPLEEARKVLGVPPLEAGVPA